MQKTEPVDILSNLIAMSVDVSIGHAAGFERRIAKPMRRSGFSATLPIKNVHRNQMKSNSIV